VVKPRPKYRLSDAAIDAKRRAALTAPEPLASCRALTGSIGAKENKTPLAASEAVFADCDNRRGAQSQPIIAERSTEIAVECERSWSTIPH
jgi:hypothetical protein